MKKTRNGVRMIILFLRLVFEMIRNYPFLNDDIHHNFVICKKVCKKIIGSAHISLKTFHLDRIPRDEKFLMVSNHRCFFDVVFMLAAIDQPISFVAAKELWNYPILRRYLDALGCVAIRRSAIDADGLRDGIMAMKRALERGNLVLFPEGECSYHDIRMKRFKKGGFVGIRNPNQKIVPVFIKIDTISNIGRWMIPQGKVSVIAGQPFTPGQIALSRHAKASDLAAYAQRCVINMQEQCS